MPDQRTALVRHWLAVGHLLGVPRDLIGPPPQDRLWDEAEAQKIVEAVRGRHFRRSIAGVHLMEELHEDIADHVPLIARRLAPRVIWQLGDLNVLTLLLVPRPRPLWPVDAVIRTALRHSSNRVSRWLWTTWFASLRREASRHEPRPGDRE